MVSPTASVKQRGLPSGSTAQRGRTFVKKIIGQPAPRLEPTGGGGDRETFDSNGDICDLKTRREGVCTRRAILPDNNREAEGGGIA